ncbi:MAG: DUF1573 domain-containing protein [Deltaproteobacteria bacterium]|nr:DUF1573 domain-containing protein [Deltaproteobacteria bacterium]
MSRCLIVLLLLLGGGMPAFAAPKLVAERLNYNFGEITQGTRVEHVFRFRNAGDQILEVGNVRSSCGCTAALLSATRIAPGDMGELRATFDSTRFKGAINKVVTIDSNDPQQRKVSFGIYGNVKAEVLLQPERVTWGSVEKGMTLNSTVRIINRGPVTINLQPPRVTDPVISAKLSALQLLPGKQVELQITAKIPNQKKRLGGYVIIATDYSNVPQLRVSVSARLSK